MRNKCLLAAAVAMSVVQSTPTFASPSTTWNHTDTGSTVGNCTIGGYSSRWFNWMPCITI